MGLHWLLWANFLCVTVASDVLNEDTSHCFLNFLKQWNKDDQRAFLSEKLTIAEVGKYGRGIVVSIPVYQRS